MHTTGTTAPRRLEQDAGAAIADGLEEYRATARAAYVTVRDHRTTSSAQELAAALYDYERAELALARAQVTA